MKMKISTHLTKFLFPSVLFVPFLTMAQFNPGLPAAFGIDADALSGQSQNGGFSANGSFDWFRKIGNGPNIGYGVIDTTGNFIYKPLLAAAGNPTFSRGMAYPQYSAVNGYLLLDARYARDNFGLSMSPGNNDFTTYTMGAKNGDNPTTWGTAPNGGTVADKADIIDSYIHLRRNGTTINYTNPSALILAMGINTVGNTGNRYIDFELFKERIAYNQSTGIFSNSGAAATGGHTAWTFNGNGKVSELGDMSVSFAFGTSGVTNICVYIWVSQAAHNTVNPVGFSFVPNEFYSSGSGYGYAKVVPSSSNPFQSWASVTLTSTQAAPWGTNSKALGGSPTNYYSGNYAANDFAEVALDLTSLGIDPALSVGANPCVPPFTRVMAKSRSSESFTSALQDFTGPYQFLDAPQLPITIASPAILKCNLATVTLKPATVVPNAAYAWTTNNGNITSNPNTAIITVDKAGKYYLTGAIVQGCPTVTDSTSVDADYYQPVATASVIGTLSASDPTSFIVLQGGDIAASNFATPFGGSAGLDWQWTGPNGFTSNQRNPRANQVGTYNLVLTETRNGCKDMAAIPVQNATLLPLVLGDFNAVYNNGYAQLKWYTSAEYKTSYFDVQRSADGINFSSIGMVTAKGNTGNRTDYGFSDILILKGMNFYRLRCVDIDEIFTYSKVVALNSNAVGISLIMVYPNPFGHKVQVRVESEKADGIQIRLTNYAGATIRIQTEKVQKGINNIEVKNVANLPPGMYELQIISTTKSFSTKIMKE